MPLNQSSEEGNFRVARAVIQTESPSTSDLSGVIRRHFSERRFGTGWEHVLSTWPVTVPAILGGRDTGVIQMQALQTYANWRSQKADFTLLFASLAGGSSGLLALPNCLILFTLLPRHRWAQTICMSTDLLPGLRRSPDPGAAARSRQSHAAGHRAHQAFSCTRATGSRAQRARALPPRWFPCGAPPDGRRSPPPRSRSWVM